MTRLYRPLASEARRAGRPVRRPGPVLHRHAAVGVPGPGVESRSGQQVRPDGIQHSAGWLSPRWPSGCGSPASPGSPTCGPIGSATISTRLSGVAHREALLLGDSFVIVWADLFGRPKVTVESAKQVAVLTDPGTRQILAAVKRWEDRKTTTEAVHVPAGSDRPAAGRTTPGATIERIQHCRGDRQPARCGAGRADLRNSDRILD